MKAETFITILAAVALTVICVTAVLARDKGKDADAYESLVCTLVVRAWDNTWDGERTREEREKVLVERLGRGALAELANCGDYIIPIIPRSMDADGQSE